MPGSDQHIKQAKHNIKFLENFYSLFKFNDWAVTVSFYAVLHIMEAAINIKKELLYSSGGKTYNINIEHSNQLFAELKNKNIPFPNNHEEEFSYHVRRKLIVEQNFGEISSEYIILYKNSKTSRYRKYLWEKLNIELLVKPCLRKIIKWANKELGSDIPCNL